MRGEKESWERGGIEGGEWGKRGRKELTNL